MRDLAIDRPPHAPDIHTSNLTDESDDLLDLPFILLEDCCPGNQQVAPNYNSLAVSKAYF